ncbi:hypothetical protein ACJMK2_000765, partial [Sinanodonta woodiana]
TTVGMCSNWKMDPDWENYIGASDMMLKKSDTRLMECAMHCGRYSICYSFFHHPTMKTCLMTQSYKRGLPFEQTPPHGWNYYTQPQQCNGDYEYNQTLGLCYKLDEDYTEYDGAMKSCESDGAKLLIINTPAELKHFTMIIGEYITNKANENIVIGILEKSLTLEILDRNPRKIIDTGTIG